MSVTIGNFVPAPPMEQAQCGRCGRVFQWNANGNFCAEPSGALCCDACGERERPDLVALIQTLRRPGPFPSAFTIAIAGAMPELDPLATNCPLCGEVQGEATEGWHVVDVEHGRPICDECVLDCRPGHRRAP